MKKLDNEGFLNQLYHDMDVSENNGTPKSSILIGFSIINHPFWGTPIFGNTHIGEFLCKLHHEAEGFFSIHYPC